MRNTSLNPHFINNHPSDFFKKKESKRAIYMPVDHGRSFATPMCLNDDDKGIPDCQGVTCVLGAPDNERRHGSIVR
jgi:hypothetical protein